MLCGLILANVCFALTLPKYIGYVNDFANILTPEAKTTLSDKLATFEKQTSNEIVVVTIPSLQGTTIEDFAVKLFENWKIGKKTKDNGLLLLVAPNEREVRIEVGYGLEPVVNDAKAGRIIRSIIIPEFKKGAYANGVLLGMDSILQTVNGQVVDFPNEPATSNADDSGGFPVPLLFLGAALVQYFIAFLARSKSAWPGGVIGIIIGIIIGVVASFGIFTIALAIGLGGLGFWLDYLLSKNYQERKAQGLPTSWFLTGGGFFGRGGGGSSSGGGFGGFGGGRSGGGGASGRW